MKKATREQSEKKCLEVITKKWNSNVKNQVQKAILWLLCPIFSNFF